MGQRLNTESDAVVMDAQVLLKREECALNMEQRPNDAAVKDVQIKSSKEECALDMGQRSNDAALKDVRIDPYEEEYASDTVLTTILTKNLQLLHRVLGQTLTRLF
jgi:hypothetical protein